MAKRKHRYVRRMRELNRTPNANYDIFRKAVENPDPEIRANAIIGLIKVTNYLLDQQLRRLEKDFVERGGLHENMTRARLEHRAKQQRWKRVVRGNREKELTTDYPDDTDKKEMNL
jgi:four helix bundle suffix protein